MSDDRVQQVIDELDPTPASEADWPVSRRQTLRALAAAGVLGAGSSSASAESVGGVIADEAVFSNYASESVSDGWELTIDDDVFALTASEDTIGLPDGGVGEEVVLPSGNEASEMIAPDGSVVFEPAIPDSVVSHWRMDEGSGQTFADSVGSADGSFNFDNWESDSHWSGGFAPDYDGVDDEGTVDSSNMESVGDEGAIGISFRSPDVSGTQFLIGQFDGMGDGRCGMRLDFDDRFRVLVGSDSPDFDFTFSTNTIYRVLLTWDDGSYSVYIADESDSTYTEENSGSYSGSISIGSDDFTFGHDAGSDYYEGVLDDGILADEAFDSDQRQEDLNRMNWL